MDARVKDAHLDPVTLEVIRNALPAISNEMAVDLQRTSYNMIIYEVRDFCTALVDPTGRLVSQNVGGVSHFIANLGVMITDGIGRFGRDGFKPGDVIISNHQRVAGQHLNNVVIYMPYFFKGELLMFAIVRAHWIDVGGTSTGFGAGLTVADPWLEGLQLDQLKIYRGGEVDEVRVGALRHRRDRHLDDLGHQTVDVGVFQPAGRAVLHAGVPGDGAKHLGAAGTANADLVGQLQVATLRLDLVLGVALLLHQFFHHRRHEGRHLHGLVLVERIDVDIADVLLALGVVRRRLHPQRNLGAVRLPCVHQRVDEPRRVADRAGGLVRVPETGPAPSGCQRQRGN